MNSLDRRAVLTAAAVVTTAALPGCPGGDGEAASGRPGTPEDTPREREYDAENPFSISLVNDGERTETVEVEIHRNGDRIFEDDISVDAGGRTTVVEFETTGRYTIRAATDDHRMETSAEIERENLLTHRAASGRITVTEDGVLVEVAFLD